MARADEIRKQVKSVWEGVKATALGQGRKAKSQFERELVRLRGERDRLLVRLGEQTLSWINKSPVPVPAVVKSTVGKLNDVVENLKQVEKAPAVEVKHFRTPEKAPAKKKKSAPKKKATAPKPAPKAKKAPNKAPVGKKVIAD